MSELYPAGAEIDGDTTSEPATVTRTELEPARDGADRCYQDTATAERRDYGHDDDAAIEARLDEADLPTRAESRAATWGSDATSDDAYDVGDEYDGDLEALLAEHDDGLPSRAESRAATWGPDATDQPDETDLGSESSDAAIEASLDEADLPTRAESRAITWGPDATDSTEETRFAAEHDADPDAIAPGPSIAAAASETDSQDRPELLQQVQASHEAPIAIAQAGPEDRTLGDTTPTGIGLKPTGEQFLDIESDDVTRNRTDRLIGRLVEGADDLRDGIGETAAAVEADIHPPPGSGHVEAYQVHAVREEHPVPETHGVSDAAGAIVMTGIAASAGLWRLRSYLRRKGG